MNLWIEKDEVSKWAYERMMDYGDPDPDLKNMIKSCFWSYVYCRFIEDDSQIAAQIKEDIWALMYCRDVKNDPIVAANITSHHYRGLYEIWVIKGEGKEGTTHYIPPEYMNFIDDEKNLWAVERDPIFL